MSRLVQTAGTTGGQDGDSDDLRKRIMSFSDTSDSEVPSNNRNPRS